jgi:hypothetical protein
VHRYETPPATADDSKPAAKLPAAAKIALGQLHNVLAALHHWQPHP